VIRLRISMAFAVFFLALRPGIVSECAQEPCTHLPHGGGETLEGFVHGGGCQASNQGYVMQWSIYTVHTRATALGWCEHRSFPCPTCPCSQIGSNERGVISIGLWYFDPIWPTWPYSLGPIYPSVEAHEVDSRVPGTTDPPGRGFTPYYIGRYALTQKSFIDPTACNMTPQNVEWSMALKSVACLPDFRINENGTINRVPNDGTPVRFVTPFADPSNPITAAIGAAAQTWNMVLQTWDENPIFNEEPSTVPCVGDEGGHCVRVLIENPVEDQGACAQTFRYPGGDDGVIDYAPIIRIRPGYSTDPTYLLHLLSHELGHLLALRNVPCGVNSVMSVIPACNTLGNPAIPSSPQPSDGLPVADTVYGPGSTASCGGWAQ
jgi:hypothetical protein